MTNIISFNGEAKQILRVIKETGDFDYGFQAINNLIEQGQKLDGAIGILIDGMEKEWRPSEHEGETFFEATVRKTTLSPITIRRHLAIKSFLDSDLIPENVRPAIEAADQKSLIRIAKAADMHTLSQSAWNKIAEAAYSGEKSVSMVIRKVTGIEPRSNWLAISIDERGILVAHAKDGDEIVHVELGRLNVSNKNKTVQKAISRITGCAGITDKVEY